MPRTTRTTKPAAKTKPKTTTRAAARPASKSVTAPAAEKMSMTIDMDKLLQPAAILLAALIIAGSILYTGNKISLGSSSVGTNTNTGTTAGTGDTTPPAATVSIDTIKELYRGDYMKFGDENRDILFVEVADPSCPYCHIAGGKNPELNKSAGAQFLLTADGGTYTAPVPEMKKLVDEGKASFMYIYSPGHGNGEMGMRALYCAYEEGKFWEVHDLLMSSAGYDLINEQVINDKSKSQLLVDFLKSAIDPTTLKNCIDSGKYDSRLQSEPSVASSLGVTGTPGFFVNTTRFDGAYGWDDMQTAVESAN